MLLLNVSTITNLNIYIYIFLILTHQLDIVIIIDFTTNRTIKIEYNSIIKPNQDFKRM